VDRWEVAVDLLDALDGRLEMAEQNPDTLVLAYREMCTTLGIGIVVETPGGVIRGSATDIDERGSLLVRTDAGIVVVDAGDVSHLHPTR
jgi:BirA family biotin operon repressor/biotin-[acetyl-CoA-carboxylase] ligase